MNRVLRVTEGAGSLSDEALAHYEFERRAIKGVRNRLAHAYGDVDTDIVWDVVQGDFPKLLEGCQAYCDDLGLELEVDAMLGRMPAVDGDGNSCHFAMVVLLTGWWQAGGLLFNSIVFNADLNGPRFCARALPCRQ